MRPLDQVQGDAVLGAVDHEHQLAVFDRTDHAGVPATGRPLAEPDLDPEALEPLPVGQPLDRSIDPGATASSSPR